MGIPGFAKDESVSLAGEADSGCVDDGHHDINVLHDGPVEELLVAVLEACHVDVPVQVIFPAVEVLHDDEHLLLRRPDDGRQQAMDPEQLALLDRERLALTSSKQQAAISLPSELLC